MKISIGDVKIGMVLAEDVYDFDGLLLVNEGTVLQNSHIDFLTKKLIDTILIKDSIENNSDKKENIKISDDDCEPNFKEHQKKYKETVKSFKKIYQDFKMGKVPILKEIEDVIEPLYDTIINDESFANKMWQIQANDEYTFDHSVRVSMIAGLLAKWLRLDSQHIKDAALAGFLHDIGKCNIPDSILNKPGQLTDEEMKVMKTHSILGYLLIKELKNLSPVVQLAVLQHHEKIDGSGYPNGIKGNEILDISRILALSDVFCAMTQKRVYKPPMHPFEVMVYILEQCSNTLDFSFARTFLSKIAYFYIGTDVRLSNGEHGTIVMTYKDDPARPMVKVGENYIDLRKDVSIHIASVEED